MRVWETGFRAAVSEFPSSNHVEGTWARYLRVPWTETYVPGPGFELWSLDQKWASIGVGFRNWGSREQHLTNLKGSRVERFRN